MPNISSWLLSFFESEEETLIADAQIAEGGAVRAMNAEMAESYLKHAGEELIKGNAKPLETVMALTIPRR